MVFLSAVSFSNCCHRGENSWLPLPDMQVGRETHIFVAQCAVCRCLYSVFCKQAHHNSALRTHLMIITDMTIRELITIPHGGVASLPPSFLVNQLQDLMARYLKQLTFPHNPLIQAETAWIYFPRQGRETSPRCGDHPNQVVFVHHIFCYHLIFNVRSCSTARTVSRCLT